MKVDNFKLSNGTRDRLMAGLGGLEVTQRDQTLSALADFAAEVEIHCRKKAKEDLRQEWSSVLAVMLSRA